jgi:hypothetical protein
MQQTPPAQSGRISTRAVAIRAFAPVLEQGFVANNLFDGRKIRAFTIVDKLQLPLPDDSRRPVA